MLEWLEWLKGKKEKQQTLNIPAELFYNVFQGHPDGQKILDELAQKFYDPVAPADPHAALYMSGQRSVVAYIIARCAEGNK